MTSVVAKRMDCLGMHFHVLTEGTGGCCYILITELTLDM